MTFFMRSLNYFLSLNRSKFYYIFYLIPKSFSRIVLSFIPLINSLFDIFAPTISPSELGVLAPIFDIFSPHHTIIHSLSCSHHNTHRRLAAIAAHLRYPRCPYHKIFLFWPTAVRTSAILSCLTISLQHSPCRLLSRIIIQVSLFLFFSVVPLRHLLAVQLCIAFAPVPSSLGRRCQ